MGRLKAAAGKADLEPHAGLWMTGFASRLKPAASTHDPITARGLLLDDGEGKLAVVVCDLLGFTPQAVGEMRRGIAGQTSIPEQNILICCTHTHSGPTSMPMRGTLGHLDDQWLSSAQARIVELVRGLCLSLQPAGIRAAFTPVSGIGHNRQDDAHAIDEELGVLAVDAADGTPIATVLNYATHAVVLGPDNLEFSADFPGAAARSIEKLRGGLGMYMQGACGDVDPLVYRNRGWGRGTFEDAEEMGRRLAEAAAAAVAQADTTADVRIRAGGKTVDVPLDPPPSAADLAAMIATFESDRDRAVAEGDLNAELVASAMLDWSHELEAAIGAGSVPESVPAEVFAAALNDLRIVGLPFETYGDIGVGIKTGLKPLKTFFAGYANGLFGYCPTGWAKDQGGYGAYDSCRWFGGLITPIGYGADELLVREAVSLAAGL